MPLYEYECAKCQKVHEVMQKFSDAPLAECPDCHGAVRKLMSLGSFALKGSGWYATDYKRSKTPAADASPAPSGASAAQAGVNAAVPATPSALPSSSPNSSPNSSGTSSGAPAASSPPAAVTPKSSS